MSRSLLEDDGARYRDDPRLEVARLMPEGDLVLDVGCSRGAFGQELRRRAPHRRVYGIEPTAAVHYAAERLDEVVRGEFPDDVPADWPLFDVICFNDVLEHLTEPWSVLRDSLAFLAPGGHVVASIPNVRNVDVLWELAVRGAWQYRETGILDRSHLRFFTRNSIVEMFESAGLIVETLAPTHAWENRSRVSRLIRRTGLSHVAVDLVAQRYVVVSRTRSLGDAPNRGLGIKDTRPQQSCNRRR